MLLKGKNVTDNRISQISKIKSVKSLEIIDANVTDRGIQELATLGKLRELHIWNCPLVTEQCLPAIGAIVSLESLSLGGLPSLRIAELGHLPALPNLDSLQLSDVPISADVIRWISECRSLTNLGLVRCGITDQAITPLSRLQYLRGIDFSGNDISGVTLGCMHAQPRMHLYLRNCPVTDEGLGIIAQVYNDLKILDVSGTDISDAGLEHIGRLEQLDELKICFTSITDAGFARLFDHSSIAGVEVEGTNVTDQAMERLIASKSGRITIYVKSYRAGDPGQLPQVFKSRAI